MTPATSIQLLLRWRDEHDHRAAEEFLQRHLEKLIGLVRSKMFPTLAQRLDPEDVAQSACRSFYIRIREKDIEITADSKPWSLLATIALRKLYGQLDFHGAQKRSPKKEQAPAARTESFDWLAALPALEPTPEQEAAVRDELALILQGFSDDHRAIIGLHLQRYSSTEIAAKSSRSDRMVRYVIERFEERLDTRVQQLTA